MTNTPESITFSLEIGFYDPAEKGDREDCHVTPQLGIYCSAADATADREGLDIVEGDLWFYAADGSLMQAQFSEEPYVSADKPTYFPGIYGLHPGSGEPLLHAIARIIAENGDSSPRTRIVVSMAATDEVAKQFGWPDMAAMKEGVKRALRILPPDMFRRLVSVRLQKTAQSTRYSVDGTPIIRDPRAENPS